MGPCHLAERDVEDHWAVAVGGRRAERGRLAWSVYSELKPEVHVASDRHPIWAEIADRS
jgi:hypothetical protein